MVAASIVLSTLFEDQLNTKITAAINKQLRAPFATSAMELDIFRHFPNASIHLKEVLIKEALPDKVFADTLLFAEDLYLEFGLLHIFSGDITIREISASGVLLRTGVDIDGSPNYQVWNTDSTGSDQVIDLEKIQLTDLALTYTDIPGNVDLTAHSTALQLAGLFNANGNRFDVLGEVLFDSLIVAGKTYLQNRYTELDVALLLPESPTEHLHIQDGQVIANGVVLNTSVSWNEHQGDEHIAIRLKGTAVDLEGTASLIPEFGSYLIEHYGIKGTADIDLLYAGSLNKKNGPQFDIKLNVVDGQMKERNTGVTFQNIAVKGGFTVDGNGIMNALVIESLSANAGKGSIAGNLKLNGNKKAQLQGSVRSTVELSDLFHFAQQEEEVKGRLNLKSSFKGSLNLSNGFRVDDLKGLNITGEAELGDASFQLNGMRHGFENMNASLVLAGADATVKHMQATLINDPIKLQGKLKGLVNYLLFENEKLEIVARVEAEHLDLAKAISTNFDTNAAKDDRELSLPKNMNARIELALDTLHYASFHATAIHGNVSLENGMFIAKPISFNTAEGTIIGAIQLNTNAAPEYPLTVKADLKDVNVQKLFVQFDEFGQDFITSKHLKGTAHANVELKAPLSRGMKLNTGALKSKLSLNIKDGELIAHQPMIQIADFIRSNAIYSTFIQADELEKRLTHIYFEELTNTIRIENGKVIIPNMAVQSTAMNLTVSGVHGFDDQVDHHVNFRLAELLTKKNKNKEFGPIIDDGTGSRIFLRMHGPINDLQISNDKEALALHRKTRRQERNKELKNLITGKSVEKATTKKDGPIFNVEFDDDDEEKKPPKKKKGLSKFLTKKEEKEEKAVSFTVDP